MSNSLINKTANATLATARRALQRGIGFCLCRFPQAQEFLLFSDKDFSNSQASGHFEIQPWKETEINQGPITFYPADFDKIWHADEKPFAPFAVKAQPETTRESYTDNFRTYMQAMAEGRLKKSILSRIKWVAKPDGFSPTDCFESLCEAYPGAMVYLLAHPTFGCWMGASPEVLLEYSEGNARTVSLAGTQPTAFPRSWTPKEKEEQSLVSEHIREVLKACGIEHFHENGPHTVASGPVSHLKSEFTFALDANRENLTKTINSLHPTPAIAGLPVAEARTLIDETEQHKRLLYTGYLGWVDIPQKARYYVNLRCMHVAENNLALYLGGGITRLSVEADEWEETEQKARTLIEHIHA